MNYVIPQELLQNIVNFLVAHPDAEKKAGLTRRIQFVDAIGKLPTLPQFQSQEAARAKTEKEEKDRLAEIAAAAKETETLKARVEELESRLPV